MPKNTLLNPLNDDKHASSTSMINDQLSAAMPDLLDWQDILISQIIRYLKAYYCAPEQINFPQLTSELHSLRERDKTAFIEKVNEILERYDKHMRLINHVVNSPDQAKEKIIFNPETRCAHYESSTQTPPEPTGNALKKRMKELRGGNYGFLKTPPMGIPDDVGYIAMRYFDDPYLGADKPGELGPTGKKSYAMIENLQSKKAIILDLRRHKGGSPEMVRHFVSFFFQQGGLDINRYEGRLGETVKYKTLDNQNVKLLDVPVYILTSEKTFSAGESLAYALQQMSKYNVAESYGRFHVIGSVTKGGAHSWFAFPLLDSPDQQIEYMLEIPYRRNVNHYSNTNWEDGPENRDVKGVKPDREIKPGEDALEVAIASISASKGVYFSKKPR